jgi:deoxyribodipyrimidine photo-lyase
MQLAHSGPLTPARPSLVWFREDLRLDDHPALAAAAQSGPVCAVYVLEDGTDLGRPLGGALKWWLHHSLKSLQASLSERGIELILLRGDPRRWGLGPCTGTGAIMRGRGRLMPPSKLN